MAGQVIVDLSLMSAIAVSLPDSPQSPLPPLRSMKLSVNRHHERADTIRNTSGQVTSIVTDPKGKGRDQGHGAGDGPQAGMASPPLAYNAGFGFGARPFNPDLSENSGDLSADANGTHKRNSNATKRSLSEAWRGDESSQPRQDAGSTAFRKPSLGSRHSSGSRRDSNDGVLDAASKKSMMDGLGGATEYEPSYESAHGSFQSTTPLNFGSALPPMMHGNGSLPMPGISSSLDPRWQFGPSSAAHASNQGMFDPTYAMGYPGAQGLGGISNSYFGRQISSDSATPSGSGTGSSSGSQAGSSHTSILSHLSPRSLPPYTVVTFGSGATAKQIDKASHFSPWGAFHVPLAAFPVGSAVMMTGGFGFLGRLHGLSMDNLLEIEYVLSDGRIVWLSGMDEKNEGMVMAVENPDGTEGQLSEKEGKDLWFAIRGAGTTMGIATRYRAKAFHVPVVYAGNLI